MKASTDLKQLRQVVHNSHRTYGRESMASRTSYMSMLKARAWGQTAKLGWALELQLL